MAATSSTRLAVSLIAPARSAELSYSCKAFPKLSSLPVKTFTGGGLHFVATPLSPYVIYNVKCTSSRNNLVSCDSQTEAIRMPSDSKSLLPMPHI